MGERCTLCGRSGSDTVAYIVVTKWGSLIVAVRASSRLLSCEMFFLSTVPLCSEGSQEVDWKIEREIGITAFLLNDVSFRT